MRYILIEIDDTLDENSECASIEDIACSLADHLSDDIGVIAQVISPLPKKLLEAIQEAA